MTFEDFFKKTFPNRQPSESDREIWQVAFKEGLSRGFACTYDSHLREEVLYELSNVS